MEIKSLSHLEKVLRKENVPTNKWNVSVNTLYKEIQEGTCRLGYVKNKLHRYVDVVYVRCFHTSPSGTRFKLVETLQHFNDGVIKQRDYDYISEKLKIGPLNPRGPSSCSLEQSPLECAAQELRDQLPFEANIEEIVHIRDYTTAKESKTYTGLVTIYTEYIFRYEVPRTRYRKIYIERYEEGTSYFEWRAM